MSFTGDARELLDDFRANVRRWEAEAEGLLLSFIGKLPGLAVRLSLVLANLDWAADGADEPRELGVEHFGRSTHLIEAYILPMARRAYADASTPKPLRAARRLIDLIRTAKWHQFTSRDVMRSDRAGMGTAAKLNPALETLIEGDCIRPADGPHSPKGGRPPRLFLVNPAIHEG